MTPADICPEEEGNRLPVCPVAVHSLLSRIQWSGLNQQHIACQQSLNAKEEIHLNFLLQVT